MLKCQQLKDSEGDKMKLRVSKYPRYIAIYDNKKKQGLDGSKGKGDRYVSLFFLAPHPPP